MLVAPSNIVMWRFPKSQWCPSDHPVVMDDYQKVHYLKQPDVDLTSAVIIPLLSQHCPYIVCIYIYICIYIYT